MFVCITKYFEVFSASAVFSPKAFGEQDCRRSCVGRMWWHGLTLAWPWLVPPCRCHCPSLGWAVQDPGSPLSVVVLRCTARAPLCRQHPQEQITRGHSSRGPCSPQTWELGQKGTAHYLTGLALPRMAIGLAGKGRAAELKVPMTEWIITRNQRSGGEMGC